MHSDGRSQAVANRPEADSYTGLAAGHQSLKASTETGAIQGLRRTHVYYDATQVPFLHQNGAQVYGSLIRLFFGLKNYKHPQPRRITLLGEIIENRISSRYWVESPQTQSMKLY